MRWRCGSDGMPGAASQRTHLESRLWVRIAEEGIGFGFSTMPASREVWSLKGERRRGQSRR